MQENFGVLLQEAPADWQILQRGIGGTRDIALSGTFVDDGSPDVSVQARVVREDSGAPVTRRLDWTDAEVDASRQHFSIVLQDVPQGGLYRIETRVARGRGGDRRGLRGDLVHHLGVGDLFVIAGQSNASGTAKGVIEDGPMLGVHLFGNDEQWKLATHPLDDSTRSRHLVTATGGSHRHSPWLMFAKTIWRQSKIPVGLIPTALGGSEMARWDPREQGGADLWHNMVAMIQSAGADVAGVLWYQGESDANQNAANLYEARMRAFIHEIRKLVGRPNLPMLMAQLNRFTNPDADHARWSQVREMQRQLAAKVPNTGLVVTIDLSLSDEIHNDAAGNVVLGQRFAQWALVNLYGLERDTGWPEPVSITAVDPLTIAIQTANASGEWSVDAAVGDGPFRVEDEIGEVPLEGGLQCLPHGIIHVKLARPLTGKGAMVHCAYGANPLITLRDDLGRTLMPFSLPLYQEEALEAMGADTRTTNMK